MNTCKRCDGPVEAGVCLECGITLMPPDELDERLLALEEAGEFLGQAIEQIQFAVNGLPNERHTQYYMINYLENFMNGGMGMDLDLEKVGNEIRKLADGDPDW